MCIEGLNEGRDDGGHRSLLEVGRVPEDSLEDGHADEGPCKALTVISATGLGARWSPDTDQ